MRRVRRPRAVALTSLLALVAGLAALVAAPASPASAASSVRLDGHGWGHGRGMGQYGSLGYALDHGWAYGRILNHFYGGTTAGHLPDGTQVGVRLLAQDDKPLIVTVSEGSLTTSPGGTAPRRAVRIDRVGSGQLAIADGDGCTGPFTARGGPIATSQITISPPSGVSGRNGMLQLCEHDGAGTLTGVRWYRGTLSAVDTDFGLRSVNRLAMEDYLRGVVPRESPASWGDLGGGKGMEALKAQAVSARSYAAAEARYSYAQTCDTISCQVYGGHARQPVGGAFVPLEDSRTDSAIAATTKEIRIRSGAPARSEFSSSTGGYSAGGAFPAVVDDGDRVSYNPNHRWQQDLAVSTIEAKYGKGSLFGIDILARNGLGSQGGRVTSMKLRFSGGDVSLSGDQFRRDMGLKSNWFAVTNLGPTDSKSQPAGGYLLRADGTIQSFGSAPARSKVTVTDGAARAIAVGGPAGNAGYVLDGFGALHAIGGAPVLTDGTPRWTWDIARDAVLRSDGRSGYLLDGFGAVHPFGGAPDPKPQQSGSWVSGQDTARVLLLRPDGRSGYLVKVDGSVWSFGGAPAVQTTALPSTRRAVGALLHPAGDRGWVVDDAGSTYAFGAGAKASGLTGVGTAGAAAVAQRADGRSGYTATTGASIVAFGGATAAQIATIASSAEVRDVAAVPEPAGYVLDGLGGLHPFGGAPRVTSSSYWPGGGVAKKVVAFRKGGWVLDAYGQVYPFATEAGSPPAPSWSGRLVPYALVRDVAVIPGTNAGYVLDGWGGLHAFGGAPRTSGGPYWPGWDIAAGFGINPGGTGGYVLDAWGAVHPFAIGSNPRPPASKASAYWPGWKIVRGVTVTGTGQGYTFDGFGGVHPFGGASGKGSWYWHGQDMVTAAAHDGTSRAWSVYLDAWGGLHTAPEGAPLVTPTATWPGWKIALDLSLLPRR